MGRKKANREPLFQSVCVCVFQSDNKVYQVFQVSNLGWSKAITIKQQWI